LCADELRWSIPPLLRFLLLEAVCCSRRQPLPVFAYLQDYTCVVSQMGTCTDQRPQGNTCMDYSYPSNSFLQTLLALSINLGANLMALNTNVIWGKKIKE
jgi:hypothetical protein